MDADRTATPSRPASGASCVYEDDLVTLHNGDCLDVLATLPDCSVDAVVTDPPYGLGFMGKEWDNLPPGEPWARECLRVLKPGGHLLAFGGTRTAHRLASAIEDAGFELRDTIAWLYGSGFPKSRNLDGDWQGWGTALKPAHEPIVVARRPLSGTVAANVQQHSTGALNIDGCRIATDEEIRVHNDSTRRGEASAERRYVDEGGTNFAALPGPRGGDGRGRWPTNVVLDADAAATLDAQSGVVRSSGTYERGVRGIDPSTRTGGGATIAIDGHTSARYDDTGGASRFFPTFRYEAKAPSAERPRVASAAKPDRSAIGHRRCAACGKQAVNVQPSSQCRCPEPEWVSTTSSQAIAHPTVKPLDLMRWLVRLVTPPGGMVLDTFAGSGTTAEACIVEGFRCIAIEREADYIPLILARLTKPIEPVLFGESA